MSSGRTASDTTATISGVRGASGSRDITTSWQYRALCRGTDVNLFFSPNHLERKDERLDREARAKAVCETCDVRRECLEYALATREPHGIWGGLNEQERRQMLTRRAG